MLFPTVTFAIFFMIVLPVSWLLMPRRRRWKLFMLAASYFFYGYWNWRFCFLLAASTIANQLFAERIHNASAERTEARVARARRRRQPRRPRLLQVLRLLPHRERRTSSTTRSGVDISPEIVAVTLPVGISFFTFQALSYVIDIYRGTFEPGRLLDFAVFLSFFPHVVAGPIVRPAEFMPQLEAAPRSAARSTRAARSS